MFWKRFSLIERVISSALVAIIVLESWILGSNFYYRNATIVPRQGGIIKEGMLGQPQFINPLYARSVTDKSLSSLVFAGLVGYNEKHELSPVLAERWEVSADKQNYKFYLRKDLQWSDGQPFTVADVSYTLDVMHNPDYSESLKPAWDGVSIDKLDDWTLNFKLSRPSPNFLYVATEGILPRYLWIDVAVRDFPKSSYNLNPIGLGPYRVDKMLQNKEGKIVSVTLSANKDFALGTPNILTAEMKFYDTKEALIAGFSDRDFTSFGIYSFDDKAVAKGAFGYSNHQVNLPQYVGVFFNAKRPTALNDKIVRQALAYATNKERINRVVNYGAGVVINSPILPDYLGFNPNVKNYEYDKKKAVNMLSQAGWLDQNRKGVREKDGKALAFEIIIQDDPQFARLAEELAEMWGDIGVQLNIKKVDTATLEQQYVNGRNYDLIAIGESLGADADPYSFWHSSQINYPGLNLAMWENGEADKLLEDARQTGDTDIKVKDYEKFQELVAEELPAILLYQPTYVYRIYGKVKGIDLSGISSATERFFDIQDWYVKYDRVRG